MKLRLASFVNRPLKRLANTQPKTEEEFYKDLFTRNKTWNQPTPNKEELLRWNIITNFITYIKDFRNETSRNFRILDLGCGRGWMTNLLAQYGKVKGVEPVMPVISYAKEMFPHLDLVCGTAKDLLKANFREEFDLIVVSEVIEHIPDEQKKNFVNDIRLLLNKSGFAIITTPRKEAEAEWKRYAEPNQPVENWLTEMELSDLFTTTGFHKHLLNRLSISPTHAGPPVEIYQLWLFQKQTIGVL